MSHARYLIGDVFERLTELPENSVDLVLTSPPFLALRSYLPADHSDKHKEIGSEPTPAEFLDTLLALTAEWDRVLAPHGSICVELGDTYAGSGGSGGDYNEGGLREGQGKFEGSARRNGKDLSTAGKDRWASSDARPGWPLAKSLTGIPHLYHLSLAYGRNLLTGEPSPAGQWRVRNVVAWCRPNPPVGALGDKVRPATSYMTIACRARDRYFDLDAIRTPLTEPGAVKKHSTHAANERQGWGSNNAEIHQNENGAPPLDHWWFDEDVFEQDAWHISTQPFKGAHYATWPAALCARPIKAMCPQRVCTECGEPSRRIVSSVPENEESAAYLAARAAARAGERLGMGSTGRQHVEHRRLLPTGEWTDCGHDSWRTGIVLDPFAGSGTTLAAATGEGRDAIGIDLDERNADLARERVGMFLTIEDDLEAVH